MSIYNLDTKNDCKVRFDTLQADDIYQLNRDTGIYERVGHSGGPDPITELPYYLKSNSIQVENSTISNTVMDSNSFDVVDIVNNKSSSLLSDRLVLGDVNGNSELTKPKLDLLNELNLGVTTNPVATSTTVNTISPIVYNTSDKKFYRAHGIRLGESGLATQVGTGYVTIQGGQTAAGLTSTSLNIFGLSGGQFLKGESGNLYVYNNIDKNQSILNKDGLRIGTLQDTGYLMNMTKSNLSLTKNSLSIFNETLGTTTTANLDSFQTLNKIRDMTAGTLNDDAKMVLYNTVTKQFCYYDIWRQWMAANDLRNASYLATPTSGTKLLTKHSGTGEYNYIDMSEVEGPSYLKENSIKILKTSDPNEYIEINPDLSSAAIVLGNTTINNTITPLFVKLKNVGGERFLEMDDLRVTNNLKNVTAVAQTNKRAIYYEPGTKVFSYNDYSERDILEFQVAFDSFFKFHIPATATDIYGRVNDTAAPNYSIDFNGLRSLLIFTGVAGEPYKNYYPKSFTNLKVNQWLKIDFNAQNMKIQLTDIHKHAVFPLHFPAVPGDAIGHVFCVDQRLNLKLFRMDYEHRGSLLDDCWGLLVSRNELVTNTEIIVTPKIFIKFFTANEAKTADAVVGELTPIGPT